MLVRFCTSVTSDPHVAEDLAHQTLLRAWEHERQLRDPSARTKWLLSIARNLCYQWARRRSRVLDLGATGRPPESWPDVPDGLDLEEELVREDLASLLDRALALLPAQTRRVLVEKYLEERSQEEVAERLGLSVGSVESRLHRGRVALRRVLETDLQDEAESLGLLVESPDGWQRTRIWCPVCGQHRLEGRWGSGRDELDIRCPGCHGRGYYKVSCAGLFEGIKSFKPALTRVHTIMAELHGLSTGEGVTRCTICGGRARVVNRASAREILVFCPACGVSFALVDYDPESLALALLEGRRFWRDNPRIRTGITGEVESQGVPGLVVTLQSLAGSSRLDVVLASDDFRLLGLHRRG